MDPREVGTIRVSLASTIQSIDRIVDAINRSVMLGQDPSTDEWDKVFWTLLTSKRLLQEVGESIPHYGLWYGMLRRIK